MTRTDRARLRRLQRVFDDPRTSEHEGRRLMAEFRAEIHAAPAVPTDLN